MPEKTTVLEADLFAIWFPLQRRQVTIKHFNTVIFKAQRFIPNQLSYLKRKKKWKKKKTTTIYRIGTTLKK